MSHFQYITLGPREIRVLELQPGADEDSLVGHIRHHILSPEDNDIPMFEALSYTWGNASRPQSIILRNDSTTDRLVSASGETILNIGNNLEAALRSLRLPTEKRMLWCDQICINQEDLEERGYQVQRMSDIYRFADRVVVWLGPETSWSAMAMETIRWASEQVELMTFDRDYNMYFLTFTESSDKRVSETMGPLPLSPAQWLALEQLLALDWYKRLWTYQEIVLADIKTCIIRLGSEEMSCFAFIKGLHLASVTKPLPPNCFLDKSTAISNINLVFGKVMMGSILDAREDYGCAHETDWFNIITITNIYECSDSRDKVFATQGLVAPALSRSLKPDYFKSAKDILTHVCLDHIERNKEVHFLSNCNAAASPSWVADLERHLSSLTVNAHVSPYSPASAYLVEPGILEVAGITGDELFDDPVPWPNNVIAQTDTDHWQGIVEFLRDFVGDGAYQDENCLNKFIAMMTFGNIRDSNIQKLQPIAASSLHSLQEWRWKLRRWLNGTGDEIGETADYRMTDRSFLSKLTIGETVTGCATTCNGDFVRVPLESRSGDIITVLLGSQNPIVLRPQSPSGYTVIGPCYHAGLAKGVALLGNDFKGWEPLWDTKRKCYAFYKDGYDLRRTDPRLDDVPLEDGYEEVWLGDIVLAWGPKGCVSKHDPRMSEEGLKSRGVPIRKYRLL